MTGTYKPTRDERAAIYSSRSKPPRAGHAKYGMIGRKMPAPPLKPVVWLGDSLRELRTFPAAVQDEMGYAIYLSQRGDKHVSAKPLKGLGSGVLEVASDHRGDTFRSVYTVRFADRVFVLHAFQKKSKRGIATPTSEIELIKQRLKQASEIAEEKE
jgi:phage-related protein